MELLFAGIVATLAGPGLLKLAEGRASLRSATDGFILVTLMGLVFLSILPHALDSAGPLALLGTAAGVVLPGIGEKVMRKGGHSPWVASLAFLGLAFHEFIDGAALAGGHEGHSGQALALAIVLHRLPLSMTVAARTKGAWAWSLIGLMVLATVAGYWVGFSVLPHLHHEAFGWFEAAIAGMLLHVALEPDVNVSVKRGERGGLASGVGALLGVLALVLLAGGHPLLHTVGEESGAFDTFVTLAFESSPALLLGYFAAGVLPLVMQTRAADWLRRGGTFSQAARGMIFGMPLPLCSCSVVPTYKALVLGGVPAAAGISFLIATPELGVDSFFLSFALLGPELALARLGAAVVVALATALLVARAFVPPEPASQDAPDVPKATLSGGMRYAFGELLEHTMPWVLLGLGMAAMVEPILSSEALSQLPAGLDVPLLALLGMPAYICASGATPLAAVLLHKGLSSGAVVALLLTGPATNVTTFGILARLHSRRAALWFGVVVASLSIVIGWLVNALDVSPGVIAGDLHEMAHTSPTLLEVASLVCLTLLTGAALLRRGVRGFLGEVVSAAYEGSHAHEHGDGHEGEHGHAHGFGHTH